MSLQEMLFIVFIVTLLITVICGLMIFNRIANTHRPMIIFVWAFFALQILETIFQFNTVVWDIIRQYGPLVEVGLLGWQARRLQVLKRPLGFFGIMFALLGVSALVEHVASRGFSLGTSWSSIAASFLVVLLAIELLNNALINHRGALTANPVFLFSVALIFFYTFNGLVEVFLLVGQYTGTVTEKALFYFYGVLSVSTNLLFIKTFLCIPRKSIFSIS